MKDKKKDKICRRTSIGGQAVLEGVMMRGERSIATAVRTSSGEIQIESQRIKPLKERNVFFRLPFVRGVVNLCEQLFKGTGILLRSAEVYGDFAEPSKFENFIAKKFKVNPMSVLMGFSVVVGLLLAVGLFIFLPNFLTGLIFSVPSVSNTHPALQSLTEGAIMLAIFLIYILIVTALKDIRRVFMYHGAEHRTINCYERGLELTVENVQKMPTSHSRCGTTFLFFVLAVSILVFAFVNWMLSALGWLTGKQIIDVFIKLPVKLLFIPVVAGIAYEILKFTAKYDNIFMKILRSPGMLLQKLTTKKPTDDMAEVAIAAFKRVQVMDADPSYPVTKFDIKIPYDVARKRIRAITPSSDESDIDWIFCEVTNQKRSALSELKTVEQKQYETLESLAKKLAKGMPLAYALGYTDFYGNKISVNENVLIPRSETEMLCAKAKELFKGKNILDLCTGSGAVAVTLAKETGAKVVASDISEKALEVAKLNALNNSVKIDFIKSDMFENIDGEFDMIVSNPPYIKRADISSLDNNVKDFEPHIALDGGDDGLDFYRIIAKNVFDYLAKDGIILMEVGIGQADAVKNMFDGKVEVYKDLEGIDRIVAVWGK